MSQASYRGVVRGGVIHLMDSANLSDGTEVIVTVTPDLNGPRGSGAAIIAAMKSAPPVPPEWVDELEALIEEGRRPPTRYNPFEDEAGIS